MVTYTRPPLNVNYGPVVEEVEDEVITSSDISKNMPTTLPESLLQLPDQPEEIAPLDLSALLLDRDLFAEEFGTTPKTEEELDVSRF